MKCPLRIDDGTGLCVTPRCLKVRRRQGQEDGAMATRRDGGGAGASARAIAEGEASRTLAV